MIVSKFCLWPDSSRPMHYLKKIDKLKFVYFFRQDKISSKQDRWFTLKLNFVGVIYLKLNQSCSV